MKFGSVILFLTLILGSITGCNRGPESQIKGSWTGPIGAILMVNDSQWVVSTGVLEVTLNYVVVSSRDDTVVVTLQTQSGTRGDVTCKVSGNTLRISQPLNSGVALGGTWTRR